jgi:dynein intermediate chain
MDSEAIRKKRQDDIEAKRRRLEEMRKSRQESAAAPPPVAQPAPAPVPPPAKTEADVKQETEELVKSLLTVPAKVEAPVAAPEEPSQSREKLLQEKLKSFTTVKSFNVIDILPSSSVKYEKACQTEEEDTLFLKPPAQENEVGSPYEQEASSDDDVPSATPLKSMKSPSPSKGLFSNSKHQLLSTITLSADMEIEAAFAEKAKQKLPEEERAKITAGFAFQNFLRTTSLYVERALALTEEHDVIRDFSVDEKGTAGDLDEHAAFILPAQGGGSSGSGVSSTFEGEHLAGRPVMDLQWSHLVPELFLAAYGAKATPQASNTAHKAGSTGRATTSEEDTPGMVCVWSKDLHSRPEYRFSASSPVLAAVFHSHEQSLVLGGCYSGQILLWDMKLNKALPVQRSSMSGERLAFKRM